MSGNLKIFLNDLGMVSSVGQTNQEILARVQAGDRSGLVLSDVFTPSNQYVGLIQYELPTISDQFSVYNCKNNQLLLAALSQIRATVDGLIKSYGSHRVGVVLGTSTAGVRNTELAIKSVVDCGVKPNGFHYKQQQLSGGAEFIAHLLGLRGPAYAVSTACTSTGKAFSSARRLISLGFCDAVIVGGADSLCQFTGYGFNALDSVSSGLCKPFGQHRDGVNLSEAGVLFVMSKDEGPVELQGIGASSDAYHFSAPEPKGSAVIDAMEIALRQANKSSSEIDYINMHGTATLLNDAMEAKAVNQVFGNTIALSSTKGITGHSLGVSAGLELGLCWMLLTQGGDEGSLPPNINDDDFDKALPSLNYIKLGQKLGRRINTCQSNSFAFGGNNVSIIIGRIF